MYSLKHVLTQKPDQVKGTLLALLALAVLTGLIEASAETVAAAGIAIERVLSLFYVAPLTVSKEGLALVQAATDDAARSATAAARTAPPPPAKPSRRRAQR